ncbi:MAG: putative peptidoglycan biosynthesis protein MurJ [Firmicutes bacterium ADurb.Bin506]|nr:MAG: putative peptidoglycan biosynthesis protein MurJ [Firmicutes bacterium ADurb.Bin506]
MSAKTTGSIARFAGVVALGAILSKLLGFLRETALASQFGATYATDAYFMAMVIPTLLLMGVGPAVTTTLIPVFADMDKRRGRKAAFSSVSVIINASTLIAAMAMVAGILLVRPIVSLVAPGFSGTTYELTVKLTVLLFPIAVFTVLTHCVTGVLQALGLFTVPAMTGIVQNVIVITSILVFGPMYGIVAVAVGTALGALSMFIVQLPVLHAAGYRHRMVLDWHDEGLRSVGRLMGPIVAGTAASQAGTLVIRTLASRLPEGSITYLNYSQRLAALPSGVFGTALVTVLYPTMARLYGDDKTRFIDTFRRSVGVVFFTLAPMAAGLILLASPVVRLAFERGAFTPEATTATAASLAFLSAAVPFTALSDLANKAFYAAHNTITPVVVNLAAVAANVCVSLALVDSLGHVGLAIASAFQPLFAFSVSMWLLRRVGAGRRGRGGESVSLSGGERGYSLISSVIKSGISALVMSAVVVFVDRRLSAAFSGSGLVDQGMRLAVPVAVGAVVYFVVAALLRSGEVSFVLDAVRRRSGRLGRGR